MNDLQATKGLGAFSVALGLTQLVAPNWLGSKTGAEGRPTLMRLCGARELASGIGVLSGRIDIGMLSVALVRNVRRGRMAVALGAVLGVTLLDWSYARRLQGA